MRFQCIIFSRILQYIAGVAYVDFSSEKDLIDAMRRNKNFISKCYMCVCLFSKNYTFIFMPCLKKERAFCFPPVD